MPAKSRVRTPRKRGPMSDKEKTATALILDLNPEASYRTIAQLLGRKTDSISKYVCAARDMLRYAAPAYLEMHMKAARIAAADGNAGPAQWALERIEATTDDGQDVRVVEAPAARHDIGSVGSGLTVNVGIALSQVAPTGPTAPSNREVHQPPAPILHLPDLATLPLEVSPIGISLLPATDSD